MAKKNRTKYSILGLLSLAPLSGYDVRQIIEEQLSYFWAESYSQIYPTLKRMVEEGLATVSVEEQEGKPDRKVYTITPDGLAELHEWLLETPLPESRRIELLLKLTFGGQVESSVMEAHIRHEQAQIKSMLAELEALETALLADDSDALGPLYQLINVRYGLAVTRSSVGWAEQSLEMFEEIRRREEQRND